MTVTVLDFTLYGEIKGILFSHFIEIKIISFMRGYYSGLFFSKRINTGNFYFVFGKCEIEDFIGQK